MLWHILIGGGTTSVNVVLHAFAINFVVRRSDGWDEGLRRLFGRRLIPLVSALVVFALLASQALQIAVWCLVYSFLPAGLFSNPADIVYFSIVNMTTLGMGDPLPDPWSLLGAIEAANGFIVFGWSTACIFNIMSRLYRNGQQSGS